MSTAATTSRHGTVDPRGRTATVIGVSSGIGRAVATELTAMGAAVGCTSPRPDPTRSHR